jgi:hypothetical protein
MPVLTAQRGLVTSASELTRPDGALTVADNCNIDYDNTIQKRRGFKDYNAVALAFAAKQLFTYKNNLLVYYGQSIAYDVASSGAFTAFGGTYEPLIEGLRLKGLETNGNFYFTTNTGIKKLSAATADDISISTISDAGGVKAADISGTVIPDSSGFLPAQSKVAYRLVFGVKDANSNLVTGAPSARVVLTNQSADVEDSEIFNINFLAVGTIVGGDYWTFSDTSGRYFVWYNLSGTDAVPVNADTLDATAVEVDMGGVVGPTAAQFASYTANALGNVSSISVELSSTEVEVTISDPGDVSDVGQGSITVAEALVTKIYDGSITEGTPGYAELNFSLPSSITTAYFYQLYRTGVVTVSAGVTLNDIDPGDEQQFVYEGTITSADITAGEITVTDNTPETFRESGAYLETNAITGSGITSANNPPPIAQDIALFRSSTFYANTKDFHRLNLNILSVDDFVSGTTKLVIGQDDSYNEYTFRGVAQVIDVTVQDTTGTVGGTYFLLYSANDAREYYVWFDTGGSTDPAIANKLGIRVPLSLYPDTIAGSKQALLDSLLAVEADFTAVDNGGSDVRITNTDAGLTNNPTTASTWTVAVVVAGDGENVAGKTALLSLSASVGIAIDLTARSLVKVINRDADCPVTAQYLSSNEDLPGKILFEAKSLEDKPFFIGINDSALSAEFNPEVSAIKTITTIATGTNLFTTSTAHNLSPNDVVYVNDNPGATPVEFAGKYVVLATPSSTTFTLKGVTVGIAQAAISGVLIEGTAVSDNNVSPNRLAYSKISQPEAVPISYYLDVGSKDKSIMRILALRDNLFVLKEDGIYIVSGDAAPNFQARLLDNSAILIAPDSAVVLNNLIYALTTQGVVSISESGVSIVSRQIEDQIKAVTTSQYNYRYTSFGMAYESDRAYFLWLPTNKTDTYATQCYRYNSITNTWTRWTVAANCGLVNQLGDDKIYLGLSDRNIIGQERKNLERQDFADRNFTRSIGADAIDGTEIAINTITNIAKGDVLVQDQYVTITKFNRLLSKLDADPLTGDKDYRSTLEQSAGADMGATLILLVAKLNTDPNLFGLFTVPSGSNDIDTLKADYNVMIGELNGGGSGTALKDYAEVTDLISYEVLITEVTASGNILTVNFERPFIQGEVEIYKAIETKVRWSPQHFGKPAELKQISEGTLIFDQNTIYGGTIGYASDRSADFSEVEFTMFGPGQWAAFPWLDTCWGGNGNDIPLRTLVPRTKSRCRYLTVEFTHENAREQFKLVGISLEPRDVSTRGYR